MRQRQRSGKANGKDRGLARHRSRKRAGYGCRQGGNRGTAGKSGVSWCSRRRMAHSKSVSFGYCLRIVRTSTGSDDVDLPQFRYNVNRWILQSESIQRYAASILARALSISRQSPAHTHGLGRQTSGLARRIPLRLQPSPGPDFPAQPYSCLQKSWPRPQPWAATVRTSLHFGAEFWESHRVLIASARHRDAPHAGPVGQPPEQPKNWLQSRHLFSAALAAHRALWSRTCRCKPSATVFRCTTASASKAGAPGCWMKPRALA